MLLEYKVYIVISVVQTLDTNLSNSNYSNIQFESILTNHEHTEWYQPCCSNSETSQLAMVRKTLEPAFESLIQLFLATQSWLFPVDSFSPEICKHRSLSWNTCFSDVFQLLVVIMANADNMFRVNGKLAIFFNKWESDIPVKQCPWSSHLYSTKQLTWPAPMSRQSCLPLLDY